MLPQSEVLAQPFQCWAKSYDGPSYDWALSIQQTEDGGYIVAGESNSFGTGAEDWNGWVLKLKSNGDVEWQKTYGGAGDERRRSIQQTEDGGYIVAGKSNSFKVGVYNDAWLLKLNGNGDIEWQKTYGGSFGDSAESIQQTADGGYIVAGHTCSFGVHSGCWL